MIFENFDKKKSFLLSDRVDLFGTMLDRLRDRYFTRPITSELISPQVRQCEMNFLTMLRKNLERNHQRQG